MTDPTLAINRLMRRVAALETALEHGLAARPAADPIGEEGNAELQAMIDASRGRREAMDELSSARHAADSEPDADGSVHSLFESLPPSPALVDWTVSGYAAASVLVARYVQLYSGAVAVKEATVANVAYENLRSIGRTVMVLHNLVPVATLLKLESAGVTMPTQPLREISERIEVVWEDQGKAVPSAAQVAGVRDRGGNTG